MIRICHIVSIQDRKLLNLQVKIFRTVQSPVSLSELICGCSNAISKFLLNIRFLSASLNYTLKQGILASWLCVLTMH